MMFFRGTTLLGILAFVATTTVADRDLVNSFLSQNLKPVRVTTGKSFAQAQIPNLSNGYPASQTSVGLVDLNSIQSSINPYQQSIIAQQVADSVTNGMKSQIQQSVANALANLTPTTNQMPGGMLAPAGTIGN